MPMQFKMLAPGAAKEKIMSFYEEALLITGMSVGGMVGLQIMVSDQAEGMIAPAPLLHGAYSAVAIGLSVGKILPMAINYAVERSKLSRNFTQSTHMDHFEKACTPHTHKPSRLAGMAAGVGMAAVAYIAMDAATPERSAVPVNFALPGEIEWQNTGPEMTRTAENSYVMSIPASTGFGVAPSRMILTQP